MKHKLSILALTVGAIAFIPAVSSLNERLGTSQAVRDARFEVKQRSADGTLPPTKDSVYRQSKSEQDEQGIVSLVFDDGKRFYHPFNVATQALADNGVEGTAGLVFDTMVRNNPEPNPRQLKALEWLTKNAKTLSNGSVTWGYPLPLYYPTFTVFPGWPSAFSQARIIHAYMYASVTTRDPAYMELAKKAALAYDLPLSAGGLQGKVDGHVFYEEVPLTDEYSPHILNGHLYSVVALHDLYTRTNDPNILRLVQSGLASVRALWPYFDTGYWTKYDLVPRVNDILFVFRGSEIGKLKASLADHQGNHFPLQLVAANQDLFTYKANLPGAIAFKQFTGHPGYALKISDASKIREVAIAGLRPDVNEFYSLTPVDAEARTQDGARTFHVPVQYLSGSVLSRVYQRWHARLMLRLGEMTGDAEFSELGKKWFEYDAALERDIRTASTASVIRSVPYPAASSADVSKFRSGQNRP